jgi:hypothetical protein
MIEEFIKGFRDEKTKLPVFDREVRGIGFIFLMERFEGKHGGRITSYKSLCQVLIQPLLIMFFQCLKNSDKGERTITGVCNHLVYVVT